MPKNLPIHVISLANASDRRELAGSQLTRLRMGFDFFDAMDGDSGAQLFSHIDNHAFILHTGRQVTPGEIGCFASHKALWIKCAEEGRPLMIMEDDFVLDDRFPAAVAATAELIDELGLVRLQDERRGAAKSVMPYGEFRIERYTKTPHCAMCYALTPEIAQRLVDLHPDCRAPVDVVMKHVWQFDNPMYCLTPYTVTGSELSFDSMIGDRDKCEKPFGTALRRFLLKTGWQLNRILFNLRQSDTWIRERFADGASGIARAD